jgi:hypothetical protein
MSWMEDCQAKLSDSPAVGYRFGGAPASEPTALAALALIAYGALEAAVPKLRWLAEVQVEDGGVGINERQRSPCWPTPWAVLAWIAARRELGVGSSELGVPVARSSGRAERSSKHSALRTPHSAPASFPHRPPWSLNIRRGIEWLLRVAGNKLPPRGEGHDPTLVGWPWVAGTHSWIEPTALAVLALKAAGHGSHPRTREAVRLLIDRLLPGGGCNYGNTVVLGQELVPHVQPTGLVMLALAGERDSSGRIARSVEYLGRVLDEDTAPASLAYGLLGMAAHGSGICMADEWLAPAAGAAIKRNAPLEMAILLLAAAGPRALAVGVRRGPRSATASETN